MIRLPAGTIWSDKSRGRSASGRIKQAERVRAVYDMQRMEKRSSSHFQLIRQAGSALLDAVYPPRCPVCEKILPYGEELVCRKCAKELPLIRQNYCLRCGKPVDSFEKEYCADCELHPHRFEEGRAAMLYEKGARRAIDRLKFYNRREYVPFFGACMEIIAADTFPRWKPDCLVPVPMHRRKKAERGYDQAALLARELGRRTGVAVREDLLIRTRYTRASKKLGRSSRRKNLRGVFAVSDRTAIPHTVVLIDDIYTSGATMDEAASALKRAGIRQVFFLTACIGHGQC